MNVLIACEESQRVCIEFRKRGHNAELKPCPFCGMSVADCDTIAEHKLMDSYDKNFGYDSTHYDVVRSVTDGGCGASTGKQYRTPEEAAEAWNRRVYNG